MPICILRQYPYWTLSFVSFLVNIPLGYVRERHPKFSFPWLFWIHASIPLIIYLRVIMGTSMMFIPASIFLAVVGQLVGGRWRRRTMTVEDLERLQQVPPITPRNHQRMDASRTTVVLLNMGGPRTNEDVRDFQRRLFSDPLLIRFPLSFISQRIFAWLLAVLRTRKAQARYRLIGGGSPIWESTRKQAEALKGELKKRGRNVDVVFSFNYSPPLPEETIDEVRATRREHLLCLSLYPHRSMATTGSSIHHLKKAAGRMAPSLQFHEGAGYHLHDGYIQAFVDRIHEQIRPGESLDDFYLIFSAHSLPLYLLTEGDLYPFQISQAAAKILTRLGRSTGWVICYQSAVGPIRWLKPSLQDTIQALSRRGFRKVLVIPVSFVTDHIETLWEIDIECRRFAGDCGIEDFRMSKAIECHPAFIQALADSVEEMLSARSVDTKS